MIIDIVFSGLWDLEGKPIDTFNKLLQAYSCLLLISIQKLHPMNNLNNCIDHRCAMFCLTLMIKGMFCLTLIISRSSTSSCFLQLGG